MKGKRHIVLVHDDQDFYAIEWFGDNISKAQEDFNNGVNYNLYYKFDLKKNYPKNNLV